MGDFSFVFLQVLPSLRLELSSFGLITCPDQKALQKESQFSLEAIIHTV